jgi:2-polyprenyl-3-methyl-5-hydroxy-6-metoxy-1,4-benzoquinol methylase
LRLIALRREEIEHLHIAQKDTEMLIADSNPSFPNDAGELEASALFREPWYYRVELLPGVVTPGLFGHATLLTRKLLARCDVGGAHCLDIGPMEGMVCAILHRRGAESVTAIDVTLEHQHKVDALRHYLGIEFELHAPVYLSEAPKYFRARNRMAFDLVIFSGVLYHVLDYANSLAAARAMLRANGIMIIETCVVPGAESALNFNCEGRYTSELNTYWFATVGGLDYLLRFFRLQAIDCVYYRIPDGTLRLAVACCAVNFPVVADGDTWISPAATKGVDVSLKLEQDLTNQKTVAQLRYERAADSDLLVAGTSALDLRKYVSQRPPEQDDNDASMLRLSDLI